MYIRLRVTLSVFGRFTGVPSRWTNSMVCVRSAPLASVTLTSFSSLINTWVGIVVSVIVVVIAVVSVTTFSNSSAFV